MVADPVIDERRVESLVQELRRYAPHYTPDLNLIDQQSVAPALIRIAAQLAEAVLVRLGRAPHKHLVAFLDRLGISLLPARPARAPITFRVVSGFKDVVTVPAGTRVTAAGKDAEIPFETTAAMLAIPGVLVAAYGVDPVSDKIFPPPPGFLAQQIRTPTELVYQVQAFAAAGTNKLQLDHVTELAPRSFLRICGNGKAVVQKIANGNIVTLEAPLARDARAGTILTPVRDFEVFDGIDRQEHVLYLGGADLLTVKQPAEISVRVDLFEEPTTGSKVRSPLDIAWQFWTKVEGGSSDGDESWHDLDVTSDGTAGFSQSGSIVLVKGDELEIKEREVGGRKSRWIRAALRTKLGVGSGALPDVDTIRLSVKSGAQGGIPADQAFHNATPIDLAVKNVGFLPFGAEPRQFDQFYVASKEAFSKREAEVRLKFDLVLQTLAAPSLAMTTTVGKTELRAYSIGLRRRLYELNVTTGDWQVFGDPSTEPISERPQGSGFLPVEDSVPSALIESQDVYVFVNTEDSLAAENPPNRIWSHVRKDGSTPAWNDLGAPGPTPPRVQFSPAAVRLTAGGFALVFAVAGDGKLYSRAINSTGTPTAGWISHGSPSGVALTSAPFVVLAGTDVLVFVNGNGIVHRFRLTTSEWLSLAQRNVYFTAASRPFAVPIVGSVDAKVFVFGVETSTKQPKLFECDTSAQVGGQFAWTDLGRPSMDNEISDPTAFAPAGLLERPEKPIPQEGKHVFVRGADNHLYELVDGDTPSDRPVWKDRSRPEDPLLRDAPAVIADPSGAATTIRVVAASERNSLVSWEFELRSGTIPVGADALAVRLDENASEADNHYTGRDFHISAGPGNGGTAKVDAYDGSLKIVRLTTPLATPPDSTSTCKIGTEPVTIASAHQYLLFALHNVPTADLRHARALELRLNDNAVDTDVYSRLTGIIRLKTAPAGLPPYPYRLYAELIEVRNEYAPLEDRATIPELSWEYWNGRGWLSLSVNDGTRNFLTNGDVAFTVPPSIQSTEVAGQDNFWIRARLVGGDYGRETFKVLSNTVVSEKSSLRPPKVRNLLISYKAPAVPPDLCLTFNNLDYLDQTGACRLGGAHFRPFEPLEPRSLTLFFGFDQPFKDGPVRLLVDAAEREVDETNPPELDWSFRKDRRWKKLDADDGSRALMRQGILTLSAPEELTRETVFGQSLCWIAGSLRLDRGSGASGYPRPLLRNVFLNTVWAVQGETIADEIVGSSDGEANQVLALHHDSVLEQEDIRVREALSVEEQQQIEREGGKESVVVRDDVGGTWVRWRETTALFDAGPDDRCYLIDRASGRVQFGDGVHGRIPPAGVDNIRAFRYRTGGGAVGNVEAGKIQALATAVAGIESVFNPIPSGGGSDKATTDAMLTIGPRIISHRNRAVSAEDFEELAQEASAQVAKARCLAATNLARVGAGRPDPCDRRQKHEARRTPGSVSLILVPDTPDPRPCPSLELRRSVKDFLLRRVPSVLTPDDRIVIRPPDYVEVGVDADLFVTSLDNASIAETKARAALETLLHPLRGGLDGKGWEFGRAIWKSDVFAVLEKIHEVDRVENLNFRFPGGTDPERVVIGPNELLASGRHQLKVRKA